MKHASSLALNWALALLLLLTTSCGGNKETADSADPPANEPSPAGSAVASNEQDAANQQSSNEQQAAKKICEVISPADVQAITGVAYASTESQADFSTIKHCGYRSSDGNHSVSLTIAFGDTASQRMEQAKAFPGLKLIDFGDEAVWLAASGTLTAKFADRCAEVRISKPHGDDETRIALAKKIIELALERY